MNENSNRKQNKGGRTPKSDPSIHRHVFRLTDEENAKLLSLFEASGMPNKAKFIIKSFYWKIIKYRRIHNIGYNNRFYPKLLLDACC